ncbi:MAG: hypothetical protein GXY17_00400 [Clostridiaceae bacterium]|jgi:hypothetical protein|nr:hypothetical protein [Clostridiaceae bacterium]
MQFNNCFIKRLSLSKNECRACYEKAFLNPAFSAETDEALPSGQDFDFTSTLGGGGTAKIGWDDNIWKHWDGKKKTLKFED